MEKACLAPNPVMCVCIHVCMYACMDGRIDEYVCVCALGLDGDGVPGSETCVCYVCMYAFINICVFACLCVHV
jgi:hypothetical protein